MMIENEYASRLEANHYRDLYQNISETMTCGAASQSVAA